MPARACLVFAALLCLGALAGAHDRGRPSSSDAAVLPAQIHGRPPADPACFCWANGRKFEPGERACLRTGSGGRLATCGMVINMMSWELSSDPCPES